ncbi:MAG TPA: GNAT family N-acetyltransferase [Glaciibacter sp.]|nr:GNAT family N-acetyltransferase [Glaciibacter sp.]
MAALVIPSVELHRSWIAGAEEFHGAHIDGGGVELRTLDELRQPDGFRAFVDELIAQSDPDGPLLPGYVPCTFLWMVENDKFVGSIAIRHELNDFLFEQGGHIGYSVRPSARRRGFAGDALRDALPIAQELGISRVLITCDETNTGSRRTIEKNGGVYEDSRAGKRRYWIDNTSPTRSGS